MKSVSPIKILLGVLFMGLSFFFLSGIIAKLLSISFEYSALIVIVFCYPFFEISWLVLSSGRVSKKVDRPDA